jgi:dTDP-glucose 4,6-dehydratase
MSQDPFADGTPYQKPRKILVTGGAGFIGSHLVRYLLSLPHCYSVTVVDKLTYAGNLANLPSERQRLRFVRADICDAEAMRSVVPGHDAVVHLAAESHVDRSLASAAEFARTNVVGTQVLLDACFEGEVPRIVHVSTDEVYGSISSGAWTEGSPLQPNSPYAASKAGSDMIALAYARTHGLPVCVSRCSNNYGARQFPEKVIPLFVTALLDGHDVPVYGDGKNVREWLHVSDHCRAIGLILEGGRRGEVYNIAGGTSLTNLDLTHQLLRLCGAGRSRIRWVADRKGHDLRYALDDTKIRRELGYRPTVDFGPGLAEVVRWYRASRDWWEPLQRTPGAGVRTGAGAAR